MVKGKRDMRLAFYTKGIVAKNGGAGPQMKPALRFSISRQAHTKGPHRLGAPPWHPMSQQLPPDLPNQPGKLSKTHPGA